MKDLQKIKLALETCVKHGRMGGIDCDGYYERYTDDGYAIKLVGEWRSKCPYGDCKTGCVKTLALDALDALREI